MDGTLPAVSRELGQTARRTVPILAELRARPFVLFALALGVAMSWRLHAWQLVLLVPILAIADGWRVRGIVVGLAAIGAYLAPQPVTANFEKKVIEGDFRVIAAPRSGSISDWCLVEREGVRYALFFGKPRDPQIISLGDRLHLRGVAKPLREGTEAFWLSKGVVGILQLGDEVHGTTTGFGPQVFRWGLAWRHNFQQLTERALDESQAQMVDALCFNVDSGLDPELRTDLRRTGTVHIISASGLHVMIFAILFQRLLSRLPIPRWIQLLLLLAVLFIYAGATGFRPPVIRAVVMAGVMLSAYLFRREGDLLSAVGLAACGQMLFDPWSLFDAGFYLSFLTVAALSLYLPLDSIDVSGGFFNTIKEILSRSIRGSWVASLCSAPIVGYVFGSISLIGIFANLAIGVAIPVIVSCSLLCWALQPLGAGIIDPFLRGTVAPMCQYVQLAVGNLAHLPFASIEVPPYSAYLISVIYILFLSSWKLSRRKAPP